MISHDSAPGPAPLLTVREAQAVLHISKPSMWRLIGRGALPVIRVGHRTMIDPGDLRTFIAVNRERRTPRDVKRLGEALHERADEIGVHLPGSRAGGRLWPRTAESREKREHGLGFGEVDALLIAIAGVPAKRRAVEPVRLRVEEQQDELERVRQADVIQFRGRRERGRRVAGVERAANAAVG